MLKLKYLAIAIATLSALLLGLICSGTVVAQANAYGKQVNQGVAYFRQRGNQQLPLLENLLTALKSGNLDQAKTAYINARPPYEEIEVYAKSFEQEDMDIDARPYAIDGGETSRDFKGFHRIEALIFRDRDLKAAIPYTQELIKSVKSLIGKLNNPQNFNAKLNFAGMLSLATEVPAKKISSEEETWSDQSLLIFKHNWIGIHSQFEPYKSLVSKAIATEEESAYRACLKTIESFFQSGQVAATPYSQVPVSARSAISQASYRYREVLIKARNALKIAA